MRERETQELLKTGMLSSDRKKTKNILGGKVSVLKVLWPEED